MAYEHYCNSGKTLGKVLYQLSKIGIPTQIIDAVVFEEATSLTLHGDAFATLVWLEDVPHFDLFHQLITNCRS